MKDCVKKRPRIGMAFFLISPGWLLHAECGYKLHSRSIAHAEDAPPHRLNWAYIRAGVPLRIGGYVRQGGAWRLQGNAAHGSVESVTGQGTGQGDVSRGAAYENRADTRRISRCLLDAASDGGSRQQRRFEISSGGSSSCYFILVPICVNDLKYPGKCSLHREGKVRIDGSTRASGN